MRNSCGIIGRFVAAIAAVVLAGAALAVPAHAAGTGLNPPPLAKQLSGNSTQASLTISNGSWSCTLRVDEPNRFWGGSGGGVNGYGNLTCSHVMPEMLLQVGLYRYGALVHVFENYKQYMSFVSGVTRLSPFSSGQYQSGAVAGVAWPDGQVTYFPQVDSLIVTL
ncbi:hypothetical protein ACTG9Q_32435 [Actinokineospora sp. 24-640]